jgi:hypothetical protein
MMNVRDNKHHHSNRNCSKNSNNRHHTLPLFAELAAGNKPGKPDKSRNNEAHAGSDRANLNRELQRARLQRRRRPVNPHLAAARKLSKDIRRLRDGSQEQTLTGRAICQHLRALLQESEVPETDQETKLHG